MDDALAELTDVAEEGYSTLDSTYAEAKCEEEGLVMSLPGPHELQVDLDTRADWSRFERSYAILSRELGITADDVTVTRSRSKEDGRHVRITLPGSSVLTPWERIALQAALGSDPVRELLSCLRIYANDPRPTLLLEKPDWDKEHLPFF